jgi:hypothetical protein
MEKTAKTKVLPALPPQVFEPIHQDLVDALIDQADTIVAERARRAREAAQRPRRVSILARTTATLLRMPQSQMPLSSFVHRLNKATR